MSRNFSTNADPTGRLIAVVAASGAGKDTLLAGACAVRPDLMLARRVITRAESAGGEQNESVDELEFERRRQAGEFAIWWRAHGLSYGIPVSINEQLAAGRIVLFNGSRSAMPSISAAYPYLTTILITAPKDLLRERLIQRGRETADEIEARLSFADTSAPVGAILVTNDGSIDEGVSHLLSAIDAICAENRD